MTRRLLVLATVLGVVFFGLTAIESQSPQSSRQSLDEVPRTIGVWQAQADHHLDEETLAVLRADDHVARVYADSRMEIDLFIAYYSSQSKGEAIHSPMNCLPGTGWQPLERRRITIDVDGGQPIHATSTTVQKGLERRLVVYWYQSQGRSIANEYAAKAYLVFDSITRGRSDAALVRLIAPLEQGLAPAEASTRDFARALYPALRNYIPM